MAGGTHSLVTVLEEEIYDSAIRDLVGSSGEEAKLERHDFYDPIVRVGKKDTPLSTNNVDVFLEVVYDIFPNPPRQRTFATPLDYYRS